MRGDDLTGLGEPACPAGALDEPLADRCLERMQVLGRRRLPHPARVRCGRDRAPPAELDQQPQAQLVHRVDDAVGHERSMPERKRLYAGVDLAAYSRLA